MTRALSTTSATPRRPAARAIVAVKSFGRAKSRFGDLEPSVRHRLVWSMLVDSLLAVRDLTDELVVVSGEPGLRSRLAGAGIAATVVTDPGGDLNAAIRCGERIDGRAAQPGRAEQGDDGGPDGRTGHDRLRLAMTADLPAARPAELAEILARAAESERSYVADHTGVGTTMLLGYGELRPGFGGASAERHRRGGAVGLTGDWPGARLDVDDQETLARARWLGTGPHTTSLLDGDPALLRPPA